MPVTACCIKGKGRYAVGKGRYTPSKTPSGDGKCASGYQEGETARGTDGREYECYVVNGRKSRFKRWRLSAASRKAPRPANVQIGKPSSPASDISRKRTSARNALGVLNSLAWVTTQEPESARAQMPGSNGTRAVTKEEWCAKVKTRGARLTIIQPNAALWDPSSTGYRDQPYQREMSIPAEFATVLNVVRAVRSLTITEDGVHLVEGDTVDGIADRVHFEGVSRSGDTLTVVTGS